MDGIKEFLLKTTKNATKAAGDMAKTARFAVSLSAEEDNLKKIYVDIGKKVHEIYQFGGSLGKFFDERYEKIAECENKIAALRERINAIKGVKLEPEPPTASLASQAGGESENKKRRCNCCGAENDLDTKFCLNCGRIL